MFMYVTTYKSDSVRISTVCSRFFKQKVQDNQKKERFPNAVVVYSAILPRDHDNETIREVNKQMSAEGDHFSAYHLFERSSRQFYKNSNNR